MTESSDEQPSAPQSIQARIAALRLEQVGRAPNTPPPSYEQARKSKPPPPPLPKRTQSTDTTTGNGVGSIGNTPASVRTNGKNPPPPPPASRDVLPAPVMKKWEGRDPVASPPLPPRRPSEKKVPSLPQRRDSEMSIGRKQSMESISSVASGRSSISAMSLKGANANGDRSFQRVRAPEYDPASLPSLPERKTVTKEEEPSRVPLRPTVSAPSVNKLNGHGPPPLPGRPSLPPRTNTIEQQQQRPEAPVRPKKNILEMGFNNKPTEAPPVPAGRPSGGGVGDRIAGMKSLGSGFANKISSRLGNGHARDPDPAPTPYSSPTPAYEPTPAPASLPAGEGGNVVELNTATFDDLVLRSGHFVFVDFYAPFCKYCKELDPKWVELAQDYHPSNITIAKIDSYTEKEIGERYEIQSWPTMLLFDGKGGEPVKYPWNYDLEWMQKFIKQETGIKPGAPPPPASSNSSYPSPPHSNGSSPPPIPTGSRPNLAQLNRSKPSAAAGTAPATTVCLKCRDFSGPDTHATRFPRQSIPSQDPKWLGPQLCDPFPSHTDKARAIFTWLHHNINYNVEAFFSGNVKSSTPASTMATGLAVCEGYAALFTSLAAAAGLESVVIGGHGKGFGFDALRPGQPLPRRNPTGHAWNAVRIDGGVWKLTDPCWGAGNVKGAGQPYNKDFTPDWFTMSNDEFGQRHFPENDRFFFRDDGRPTISWEEYIMFSVGPEERTVFTPAKGEHGFDDKSFLPKANDVPKRDPGSPTVRFQWSKICPHYDIVKHHGQPYLFFMKVNGDEQRVAQSDGYNYWIDVRREELPNPGEEVTIQFMQKYMLGDGEWHDGRGLTEQELVRGMGGRAGWRSWSWSYLARWKVV